MNRWVSFEEYKRWIYPDLFDRPGHWRQTHLNSLFDNLLEVSKCIDKISERLYELKSLFEGWPPDKLPDATRVHRAFLNVERIAFDAERLFLYWPAIAMTEAGADFRAEKDLHEHWSRYEGLPRKLYYELEKFIDGTQGLLNEFYKMNARGESFIIDHVKDLPDELQQDFRIARDLFSVGVDEGGAFFAGRGLEAVLRKIASSLKVSVTVKGKSSPAHETDFADLVQTLYRARWNSDGSRVIDTKAKTLLDFLRSARNAAAHPSRNKQKSSKHEPDWMEVAKLSAKTANALWLTSSKGRRKLVAREILRDW